MTLKFLDIGEGAKVNSLNLDSNVIITDDLSKIESFVSVGRYGEVVNLDAKGNEVHTPESYATKLRLTRHEFFEKFEQCKEEIESIKDELVRSKIKRLINEAKEQDLTPQGEHKFKECLGKVKDFAINVGASLLATCISNYR